MKRAYFVGLLGAVVGSFLGLASCSEDTTTTPPAAADSGTKSDSSTPDGGGTDTGTPSDTKSEGGSGACPTVKQEGTIKDLRDPTSTKKALVNDGVKVTSAVVTSIKFRTQNPNDAMDPCIFSIFVADPNATFAPWSGVQIIAYGNKPVPVDGGRWTCETGTDAIPETIKPGDLVEITGTYTEFGPTAATCGKATPALPPPNPEKMPQIRACAVKKTGDGTLPAPAVIADPTKIAQGSTELFQWAGGRLKIGPVTAGSDLSFGAFLVKDSALLVGDDIYYRGAATAPIVKNGDTFDSIIGLSYLDFCSWTLQPSQCSDMTPASGSAAKCPASSSDAGTADAPADGG